MGKQYWLELAEAVNQFLVEDDWKFAFNEEKGLFQFTVGLDSKLKKTAYVIDVKKDDIIFYAYVPLNADKDDAEQMNNMAKFLCRANYGLINGSFELDVRDGEIRYRSAIHCGGCVPSQDAIKAGIVIPGMMIDRYAKGILAILFQDADDETAIGLCE